MLFDQKSGECAQLAVTQEDVAITLPLQRPEPLGHLYSTVDLMAAAGQSRFQVIRVIP